MGAYSICRGHPVAMTEHVAIIDYGSGNLRSVQKALQRAARQAGIAASVDLVSDADQLIAADRIILPGVGAFRSCFQGLEAMPGMLDAMGERVLSRGAPFLGICVGMQLLANHGVEFGKTPGLGWISGHTAPLPPSAERRAPHMGWNCVEFKRDHPALDRHLSGADFYFAHTYHFDAEMASEIIGVCAYGPPFPAIIGRDNLLACQFHPEKSQGAGIALLEGFLRWKP